MAVILQPLHPGGFASPIAGLTPARKTPATGGNVPPSGQNPHIYREAARHLEKHPLSGHGQAARAQRGALS